MQKQTSVCITFVLWPNTKLRRKNTSLEENIAFGYILNVNSGDGREKGRGERQKQECEGGCKGVNERDLSDAALRSAGEGFSRFVPFRGGMS